MAKQLLDVTKILNKLTISKHAASPLLHYSETTSNVRAFTTSSALNTNFFNKCKYVNLPILNIANCQSLDPADHLWDSITTVSNAGKKRGRAKTVSKKNIKDLNKGQYIGVGKIFDRVIGKGN